MLGSLEKGKDCVMKHCYSSNGGTIKHRIFNSIQVYASITPVGSSHETNSLFNEYPQAGARILNATRRHPDIKSDRLSSAVPPAITLEFRHLECTRIQLPTFRLPSPQQRRASSRCLSMTRDAEEEGPIMSLQQMNSFPPSYPRLHRTLLQSNVLAVDEEEARAVHFYTRN
ncbi:uncharacterized protein BT62DRAFT_337972 [Guyanagaster necrorhizus]|uniref:Uncharacterized protein n=1 Tax=Guyanagaster necrorhizus TaxID=856835 RepID=A0A9P7VLB7_9AGAR|nr:uncharacterized protein BT62DRAFT_337972 [Guyanagaster necrorhizus MCA 3950]KAG7443251.1 hypothetical protein BT62DRAFT_337972 [Guyanagaster necrorhizus MCA 3950]